MTLGDWLSAEPFALALSSGYFGFYAHCGVVRALEESGLRPASICGSSAGALIAGFWGAGMPAVEIERTLRALRREDFWDPRPGLGLLSGDRFAAMLETLLPVARFEDCPIVVAVSVFDVLSLATRVVDRGPLAPGIQASCTLPILFQPRRLGGRPVLDGGILDRPGMLGLSPAARVFYHHLADRSPWRTQSSMRIPRRHNGQTLVIDGLPRLGPFRLAAGPRAIAIARDAMLRALERPASPGEPVAPARR